MSQSVFKYQFREIMVVLQENYFAVSPSSYQSASTVNIDICDNHLFNKH